MMFRSFLILFLAILLCPVSVFASGGSPLVLTYAGGTGSGYSDSKFSENVWDYTYQYHVLVLTGDTPNGSLYSQIQMEQMDGKNGLAYAKLALYGKTYSLDIGDTTANFSDITLNGVAFQGANITLKPSNDFNLTIVGGSKGQGLWGADVRRDDRDKDNFTGIRTNYYPGNGIGLNATYLTSSKGTNVVGYGGEYNINDLRLNMEYGSALEGKAIRSELRYSNGIYNIGTIYRDIDTTYVVPFDYVNYKGAKGTYTTIGVRPSNNLSINLQNDAYLDRLNSDPESPIFDTRGDINYNSSSGTSIGYSGWKNDRSARDRGDVTEGEMMYITQQFYLITKNAIYYRVQPSWFTTSSSSDESYSEEKRVTGINIALFDFTHLNYEVENSTKLFKTTDVEIKPSAVSARLDVFETPIMDSKVSVASSISYRKDIADEDSTSETVSLYEDLTFTYKPNSDFSCYITTKLFSLDAPDVDRTAREQKDISFGLNYTFNTFIFMK